MDDGQGGDFFDVAGAAYDDMSTYQVITNVTKGLVYRFQYRAKNVNGWSIWSDVTYIAAAISPA